MPSLPAAPLRSARVLIALAGAGLLLSACASHQRPRPVYDDPSFPLAGTAVFVSQPSWGSGFVNVVDGRKIDEALWVRVKPGTHRFDVSYNGITLRAAPKVTVQDMRAGHYYQAYYEHLGSRVGVRVVDLGTGPEFNVMGKRVLFDGTPVATANPE